ncbi:unnamed protein product [Linum trigynum]|uniref:Uncharacterized protein n=1 Tax=Linum trigynum TaxID=586398 RepID=A0AAV2GN99_9ROSI
MASYDNIVPVRPMGRWRGKGNQGNSDAFYPPLMTHWTEKRNSSRFQEFRRQAWVGSGGYVSYSEDDQYCREKHGYPNPR